MQYRIDQKSGNKLSILGFGCMRFPKSFAQIDMDKTEQLIIKAVEKGINYFDTAFLYGGSEEALGKIISKNNLRDKIFIATKMPPTKAKSYDDFESLFQTQLSRLQTNYIDYYLIHNLVDTDAWDTLCKPGIEKWIKGKKASGEIRNIGFSFHGIHNDFLELLDSYNWDFCQIQYNYLDIHYQAGIEGLKKAYFKGLPVIIMEPLLGGKLANGLPKKVLDIFKAANASLSPAAWALRWLWNQKELTTVLSGMNEISQLEENASLADTAVPDMLTREENSVYDSAIGKIKETYKIPCTGCNYCMPCPQNVNIPACFSAYNTSYTIGYYDGLKQYVTSTAILDPSKNFGAGNCIECGQCEKKCPQHIPVIKSLKLLRKRMEPFILKIFIKILSRTKR